MYHFLGLVKVKFLKNFQSKWIVHMPVILPIILLLFFTQKLLFLLYSSFRWLVSLFLFVFSYTSYRFPIFVNFRFFDRFVEPLFILGLLVCIFLGLLLEMGLVTGQNSLHVFSLLFAVVTRGVVKYCYYLF